MCIHDDNMFVWSNRVNDINDGSSVIIASACGYTEFCWWCCRMWVWHISVMGPQNRACGLVSALWWCGTIR